MSDLTKEQVLDWLSSQSVLEMSGLVKDLEEKWGVSAAAPVAVAAPAGGGAAAPAAEEKTEFTVSLKSFPPDKKMACLKEVKAITGLGLKEAKELVEAAPKVLKEGVSKEDAEEIKKKLEAAGGEVELS